MSSDDVTVKWSDVMISLDSLDPRRITRAGAMTIVDDLFLVISNPKESYREIIGRYDLILIRYRNEEVLASVINSSDFSVMLSSLYSFSIDTMRMRKNPSIYIDLRIEDIPIDTYFLRQINRGGEKALILNMIALEKKIDRNHLELEKKINENHATVMAAIDSLEQLFNIIINKDK